MEQYLPIKGFEGLYEISSYGRIINLKTGNKMTQKKNKDGDLIINLKKENGTYKTFLVKALLEKHFGSV